MKRLFLIFLMFISHQAPLTPSNKHQKRTLNGTCSDRCSDEFMERYPLGNPRAINCAKRVNQWNKWSNGCIKQCTKSTKNASNQPKK